MPLVSTGLLNARRVVLNRTFAEAWSFSATAAEAVTVSSELSAVRSGACRHDPQSRRHVGLFAGRFR